MGNHAEASGRLAGIRPRFAKPTDTLAVPVEDPRADNPARRLQLGRDGPLCFEKLSQCREVITETANAVVLNTSFRTCAASRSGPRPTSTHAVDASSLKRQAMSRPVASWRVRRSDGSRPFRTNQIRGASPPRTPFAFARGAPRSPLRSGGRARGAPSPLCGQQQRVQSSRFEPHNDLMQRELLNPHIADFAHKQAVLAATVDCVYRAQLLRQF